MTEPEGFYYMRARYYDPEVGRFISEDPIGFEGGDLNLMAYVGNNPIMLVDPEGLSEWKPQDAVSYLNNPANGWTGMTSTGQCAKAVRCAINAGGVATPNNPVAAADYQSYLPTLGFQPVNSTGYTPQVGDIAVFPATVKNPYGHIEMYGGNGWHSDYIQKDFFANQNWKNSSFTIFRYGGSR